MGIGEYLAATALVAVTCRSIRPAVVEKLISAARKGRYGHRERQPRSW
jgi:hypothetical protein